MRLQRSPSSTLSSGTSAIAVSPQSTGDSVHTQYMSARAYHTPTDTMKETNAHGASTLVGYYTHHARQSSSLASVDLHAANGTHELPRIVEQEADQEHTRKHARQLSGDAYDAATKSQVVVSRPVSYASQAYREFLQQPSNVSSVATSAASSAISSRQSSRPTSGYASQATSGQSSRSASPMSKKEEADAALRASHMHAQTVSAAQQYIEAHFTNAHPLSNATTTMAHQVSTLSFGNMAKSDSQDSLDGVHVSHANLKSRARPNPNHFTFTEADIMKSFMRAAERDRARAEREERAREAQQRIEMEAEYERRKQQQRDMAAREAALAAQTRTIHGFHYPRDTVGDDFSSCSSDEDSQPVKHRRRFPPVPVHFKFNSHDVTKSASKPSHRQNIGHWTTFPRSSTIMLPAEQLREWIRSMIHQQQQEKLQRERTKKRQASAPNSPTTTTRKADHVASIGSVTSRVRDMTARRASLPSSVHTDSNVISARKGHTRSVTYTSEHLSKVVSMEKLASSKGDSEKGFEKAASASLLRRSSLPGHSRQNSSENRPGFERSHALKPVKGVPLAGTVAMSTVGGADFAQRRTNVLQRQHATLPAATRATPSDALGLAGYTASAPGSTTHSPTRVMTATGRLVKSTTVSPSRPQYRHLNGATVSQARSNSVIVAQHQPHPPVARKASIGGVESKNSSANNSPNPPIPSLSAVDASWQAAYEKSYEISGNQTQQKHAIALYKDVPSSGYGQRAIGRV